MSPDLDLVPGQEPNLSLPAYPCERCGEPMRHLCEVGAEYPLCRWWLLTCGECGSQQNGWEDRPVPPRWPVPAPDPA